MRINIKTTNPYVGIFSNGTNASTVVSNAENKFFATVGKLFESTVKIQTLDQFKDALYKAISEDQIKQLLTYTVSSVHALCYDFNNPSDLYNTNIKNTINVKDRVIDEVTNCNSDSLGKIQSDIKENFDVITSINTSVFNHNSKSAETEKFTMIPFQTNSTCFFDNNNGKLSSSKGLCADSGENGSLDFDGFKISIDFTSATEYTITYDIISQ